MARAVALVFAICALPRGADAQAEAALEVTLGDGAEECPSSADLRERAAQIASIEHPTHRYRVSFERSGAGYQAEIADATSSRTRRLVDGGPTCAPLGRAVAVVLATMWASEQTAPSPAPPEPPPVAQPAPRTIAAPPPVEDVGVVVDRRAASGAPSRWSLALGGGAAAALVRPIAPAFILDGAIEHAPWSFAIGGLWIPPEQLADGPGSVGVQLLAGGMRGCLFLGVGPHFGSCARVLAGALFADASGYAVSNAQTRPWFAAAIELFLDGPIPVARSAHLRYRLAMDGILPLHAEEFSVAGAGTAYQTPSFGGLLTLAIEIGTR